MNTEISVLRNNVLLRFIPWRYAGTLEIPDQSKAQSVEAHVLAVGPYADHALKVGQKVTASRLKGTNIVVGDERLCVMPDDGIYLIDDDESQCGD